MSRASLLLLIFAPTLCYSEPPTIGEPWQLVRQVDQSSIWQLRGNPNVVGTYQSEKTTKPLNWAQIQSKEFFQKLAEQKSKILKLIGISNWTPSQYSWAKGNGFYELNIEGEYTGSDGDLVKFSEVHIYKDQVTHQILFTRPNSIKLDPNMGKTFILSLKTKAIESP